MLGGEAVTEAVRCTAREMLAERSSGGAKARGESERAKAKVGGDGSSPQRTRRAPR